MTVFIYSFEIVLGVFLIEIGWQLFRRRRFAANSFIWVPSMSALWIFSLLMVYRSDEVSQALLWYRLSYAMLLPAPALTHWLCFRMIRTPVSKYVMVPSLVIAAVLAVCLFATPWVVPTVEIHPFVPHFGPLYSSLTVLTLVHVAHGYWRTWRNRRYDFVIDREADFANRFVGNLMIVIAFAGIVCGLLFPWAVTKGWMPKMVPSFWLGLFATALYSVLLRYIFWKTNETESTDSSAFLLKKLDQFFRKLLLSQQTEFRMRLQSVLADLGKEFDIEDGIERFTALSGCSAILMYEDESLPSYGKAVSLLQLQLSPEEWPPTSPLITAHLFRQNPSLFKKCFDSGIGAVFPVYDNQEKYLGQLRLGIEFSYAFFCAQDFELIQRFCTLLAEQYEAAARGERKKATGVPLAVLDGDAAFSWVHWSKQTNSPIFGSTLHLLGDKAWQARVRESLSRHFVCVDIEREKDVTPLLAANDAILCQEGHLIPTQRRDFNIAVLPRELNDHDIVEFCTQWGLLRLGLAYRSTQMEECVFSFSPDVQGVVQDLSRLAKHPSPPTLFLHGPTGVGKNLMMQAFYEVSGRSGKFVSVNCAAIPENLFESEFFGYRKGAFTGAHQNKKGFFEEAQGGVLFLDEIGDMSPHVQAKLLHVLQERKVQPVGSTERISLDVWVVSASKYTVSEMKERLRDDLFFRLVGISRSISPLKQRQRDILLAIALCLFKDGQYTQGYWRCSQDWMKQKLQGNWEGNTRQLIQQVRAEMALVERPYLLNSNTAQVVAHGASAAQCLSQLGNATAELAKLASETHYKKTYKDFKKTIVEEHVRLYFQRLLSQAGSQQEAAQLAGLSPSRFSSLLKEFGMQG